MLRGDTGNFNVTSQTHLVIVSSDAIVCAVDGILDSICVVQDLTCSINIRFAPFEITE